MSERDTAAVIRMSVVKAACQECSLRELCLPLGLSDRELADLDQAISRRRRLKKGEALFRSGEPLQALYAVRSGCLKTMEFVVDGRVQITGFHLPGELLGVDAIGTEIHPSTAEALEPTEICELPFPHLEQLACEIPGLNRQMLRLISGELRHDETLVMMLGKLHAEERLAAFLLDLSARYEVLGLAADRFRLSMSRQDLGDYLGLALETVSRLFSRFQEEALIAVQGKLVQIADLDGLRRRAGRLLPAGPAARRHTP